MAKPVTWKLINTVALVAALVWLCRLGTRPEGQDALFWPMAFTVISLLGPLSWGYHYLAPIAFLPALMHRLRPGLGLCAMLAILLPTSVAYTLSDIPILPFAETAVAAGTGAMMFWACLCLWLCARPTVRAPTSLQTG